MGKTHRSAQIRTDTIKYVQYFEGKKKKKMLPQFLIQAKFNSGIIAKHMKYHNY